jgi:hypothetical protein
MEGKEDLVDFDQIPDAVKKNVENTAQWSGKA